MKDEGCPIPWNVIRRKVSRGAVMGAVQRFLWYPLTRRVSHVPIHVHAVVDDRTRITIP